MLEIDVIMLSKSLSDLKEDKEWIVTHKEENITAMYRQEEGELMVFRGEVIVDAPMEYLAVQFVEQELIKHIMGSTPVSYNIAVASSYRLLGLQSIQISFFRRDLINEAAGYLLKNEFVLTSRSAGDIKSWFGTPVSKEEGVTEFILKRGFSMLIPQKNGSTKLILIWEADLQIPFLPQFIIDYAMRRVGLESVLTFRRNAENPPEIFLKALSDRKEFYEILKERCAHFTE